LIPKNKTGNSLDQSVINEENEAKDDFLIQQTQNNTLIDEIRSLHDQLKVKNLLLKDIGSTVKTGRF
jgi:hypothetical protein